VFHGDSELVPLSRKVLGIALLALSGCLLWYSVCSYRISGNNPTCLGDFSACFFPEAQVLNGHSRYLTLDQAGAAEAYKKAILAEPSLIDAWIGLARIRIADGRNDEARKILNIIAPTLTSISTWKWQELLFAYDLHDEHYFEQCYNYILLYLPHRIQEAGWLGSQFWGGWQESVPHVFPYNRPVFLSMLMDRQQADAAVAMFKFIATDGPQLPEKDQLRLCDFLISSDRLKEAKAVWRLLRNNDTSFIDDGRFERQPLNRAFGWRFKNDPDAVVERTTGSPCAGSSCLHIHFKGSGNVNCDLAYQIVPVEPEISYRLSFFQKGNNLSTDRGVFLAVNGYGDGKLSFASEQVLGDSPWKEEKIEFTAPAGCEAIVLHVRRNESLKMDNKISGDFWLDSVELVEIHQN
jgi:hypothetical protein